jgi:predicted amidohydrolase YtcJ
MRKIALVAGRSLIALLSLGAGEHVSAQARIASTLLVNGRIVTLDPSSSIGEAMAIGDGRVLKIGSTSQILGFAGPRTQTIDLGGGTVIPGLIDSHIHAIRAGFRYATEIDWTGAHTVGEALGRVRAAAISARPRSWLIVAGGWTPNQFAESRLPTQDEIVTAAPDHPVYIQLFYRQVLLSPKGFEAMGIKGEEDIPPHGKFERNEDGTPNGWISGDGPAITRLYDRLPKPALDESIEGTRRFLRQLNRFGLTGIIDPGGHNLAPEDYHALFRLWRERRLPLRVAYSIFAPRPKQELEDFKTLTSFLPMGTGDDMLRFNGIGECVTWGMYNNDDPTEDDKEAYYQVARWAAEQGLTVTQHWNNDRSVHHLLDVFERVNREIPIAGLRWSIAHLSDASDESLSRMRALGVGWLMQDGYYFASHSFLAERGHSRMRRSPPIRRAQRLGLPIGGGTDANRVMVLNPFVSLRWMLDGKTVDGIETRDAEEIPSREDALRFYTQGSAWFAFDEGRRGSLTPGMLADLAVLNEDYFSVPVDKIGSIESLLTMVGGQIIYAAGPYKGLEPEANK